MFDTASGAGPPWLAQVGTGGAGRLVQVEPPSSVSRSAAPDPQPSLPRTQPCSALMKLDPIGSKAACGLVVGVVLGRGEVVRVVGRGRVDATRDVGVLDCFLGEPNTPAPRATTTPRTTRTSAHAIAARPDNS